MSDLIRQCLIAIPDARQFMHERGVPSLPVFTSEEDSGMALQHWLTSTFARRIYDDERCVLVVEELYTNDLASHRYITPTFRNA